MSAKNQIIAALAVLVSISMVYAATPKTNQVFRSVVDIWTYDEAGEIIGGGSGTIISADGIILTNAHVILNEEGFPADLLEICYFVSEFEVPSCEELARIVAYEQDMDIALLWPDLRWDPALEDYREITAFERFYPAIKVSPNVLYLSELPKIRDTVDIVGYPDATGTSQINVTRGIITGNDSYLLEDGSILVNLILTDAVINAGNSGGAALDENDRFIGIPTAYSLFGEGGQYGYIIPVTTISDWIDTLVEEGIVRFNPFQQDEVLRPSGEELPEADVFGEEMRNLASQMDAVAEKSATNAQQIEYLWYAVGALLTLQVVGVFYLSKRKQV